jgi:hypothetical protein
MESRSWDRRQTPTASVSPSVLRLSNPDDPDRRLLQLFHKHFCTGEYEILEQFTHNDIVHDLMLACSLIISTKKEDMENASTKITMLYVRALRALRGALADQQRVKEDVTLVSAIVICIFEVSIQLHLFALELILKVSEDQPTRIITVIRLECALPGTDAYSLRERTCSNSNNRGTSNLSLSTANDGE